MTKSIQDIVFIGAGNVATHLGKSLSKYYTIRQVFSRTEESASALAETVEARWITNTRAMDYSSDAYLLCLPDDQLVPVLNRMKFQDQLLIHTSGSVSMDILKGYSNNYGVLYPVQTFSKARPVDLQQVPICIEANSIENEGAIFKMASRLSRNIQMLSSDKRVIIHIAAVIACNFANHMYARAEGIMDANQLDFELLKPLILETAHKVMEMSPGKAQTGPAKRNDQKIIQEHINKLRDSPELQKLYSFVSTSISDFTGVQGE
ncbi:MAG: DUF2520 domain-containing protein [Bacteroidales bacterium]|nr:DUF2520 domain-containing protein [Bacteroidales bacterium]